MKLKKLEITGFKSFYDRAAIDFPPGISAVVGPNGCGKSNIIDALRWVMGEQSVKQLRGKSMEDVIFAGANGKPPLNMAEVSLTLANDNGSAPEELKDFSEIMVTRRLYRSGESSYFLNKQPCRLKDIHNVFLGSGLGARSYAVIQQGNIGAITEASPEERRYFVEEAAGVTRYKNRKNEALRKVDITNRNLLRVADIITEIKRQMASLKRQARKAEIYNNYQKRLAALDIHLGLHYYDAYRRRIEATDALMQELRDLDTGHTSELKKLDAAVEEIKLKRARKNDEIAEKKSRQFETRRNVDRLENDLGHLRDEIERLAGEAAELQTARKNLETKTRDMVAEITGLEEENHHLSEQISGAQTRLEAQRSASQDIEAQLAQLNQSLEAHKSRLMDLVTRQAQYKNIFENAANNKESLQKRLEKTEQEQARATAMITKIEKQAAGAEKQLVDIRHKIAQLDGLIDEVRLQLDEKSSILGNQVKLVQRLALERSTARSELNTLKKMADNFEWYRDGIRAIMQAQTSRRQAGASEDEAHIPPPDDGLPAGILGLITDLIEPEPSFEAAVEAALGESLQYIIVKDQQTGLDAIDYLQTRRAGRGGFIPVSAVKAPVPASTPRPAAARMLLDHVTVKRGFEKIARILLGNVAITDDLKQAIALFNRNGAWRTIVTRQGDLVSPQGVLVGGSRDKQSGILAKKQELKTLQRRNAKLDQQLEQAAQSQKSLEATVRALETRLQQLIEEKNSLTDAELGAEKSLYKIGEELKSARRHLEILALEQEQLMGEASDVDEEMTKYNAALAQVSAEIKAAQDQVSETSRNIGTVSTQMESYHQKIVDLKLDLTALHAKLENGSGNLRRLQQFHHDDLARLEQTELEIEHKLHKQAATRKKVAELEQRLSGMYAELEQLDRTIDSSEADYRLIDERLRDSDKQISHIQNKREKTLEKFRLLELEQSQRRIKQENIANRLEERYRNSLAELRLQFARDAKAADITSDLSIEEMEVELTKCRDKIAKIVNVNLAAIQEYEQLKTRHDFLETQRNDLTAAIEDLHKVIRKINKITQQRFTATFEAINEKLDEVFPRLFEGGTARLVLTEPDKPLETGVEFMIHPPGKKLTRISLLSGGEKALAAIAFIFSIYLINPASFCLMDEIDAPLDEANVYRFNELLKIIGEKSQIIMITHNKSSMEFADTLFGITMEQKGISKLVSVNFERRANQN